MKKVCVWLAVISAIILLITWGVVGVKLLNGIYDTVIEAYITGAFAVILFGSIVCRKYIGNRCPYCGKFNDTLLGKSKFCPHCGKELYKFQFLI